ncbi:hypothetical protein [Microbacterium sp. KNMS]
MASIYGWDPLAYLALEADDARLAGHILAERVRLEEERDRGRMDYLAGRTAGLTAQAITKWLGKNLAKLSRGR